MQENTGGFELKYRPTTFDSMVGNEVIVEALKASVVKGDRTYLLFGPSGCGKTTLSWILANELGGVDSDVYELNVSKQSERGIGAAEEILNGIKYAPMYGKRKVYILNECHQGTTAFWNALLEVLEMPPEHVVFILCTTERDKLMHTLKTGRLTAYKVSLLSNSQVMKLLERTIVAEQYQISDFSQVVLREICECCNGSARLALKMLDQTFEFTDEDKALQIIHDMSVGESQVFELVDALVRKKDWKDVSSIIKKLDLQNIESLRYAILGSVGTMLLKNDNGSERLLDIGACFSESMMYGGRGQFITTCCLLCK